MSSYILAGTRMISYSSKTRKHVNCPVGLKFDTYSISSVLFTRVPGWSDIIEHPIIFI
jgi:hypothetical protein